MSHVQLTKVEIRRFKRLEDVCFELGPVTVFCGPNNFGKTTALQALTLWHAGLRQWVEKKASKSTPSEKRPGVTLNRLELASLPLVSTRQLWWREEVRRRSTADRSTENLRIEIVVDGITNGNPWTCGLEFDFPNDEALYCRPLRLSDDKNPVRMPVPEGALAVKVAMLPPMSGLASTEPKWMEGRIDSLIGQGRTAEVLRNLCHQLHQDHPGAWAELVATIRQAFHVEISPPVLVEARGELTMDYQDLSANCRFDITAAGRGQQQLMLLMAYLLSNRGTVLLLDEPDAHLEILRQRQTYSLLSDLAARQGAQIIAASHSEVILSEAAQKDTVIAFVGKPHRLVRAESQLRNWLQIFPVDHLYQAEVAGAALYLEGATDLSILQQFAKILDHPAKDILSKTFVHYLGTNVPSEARKHFQALREAYPDIPGVALFDRIDIGADSIKGNEPPILSWKKREIENYFCSPSILLRWAAGDEEDDLLVLAERKARLEAMGNAIQLEEAYAKGIDRDIWSGDAKASDVLDNILRRFHKTLERYNEMKKANFHLMARYLRVDEIDAEVLEKLDAIYRALCPVVSDRKGE
jgi:hypothetical protein